MDQIATAMESAGVVVNDATVEHKPKSPADIKREQSNQQAAIARAAAKLAPQYGDVECEVTGASVYEKFGRKSIAAIKCVVPIPALGIRVETTIWGSLVVKPDGTEITFAAAMPKGIKASDSVSKDRFLAHVENSAVRWSGYVKATEAAERELLGQKAAVIAGEAVRPKLVKRVKLATETAA